MRESRDGAKQIGDDTAQIMPTENLEHGQKNRYRKYGEE